MGNKAYVERICCELFSRTPRAVEEEAHRLIHIFERVQSLPSPLKEDLFVSLILEESLDRPSKRSADVIAA